jgi:acyl-CoA thioester hydrolase
MAVLEIPDDRGVFVLTIPVASSDIDEQNHVNNVVYVRWVQEVATAHWQKKASAEMMAHWNWVVLRHEVEYHSPALPGDTVEAHTWIAPPEGPKQKRYVVIRRVSDKKVLASACTLWCLLEAKTGRPRRVTPEITELFGLQS